MLRDIRPRREREHGGSLLPSPPGDGLPDEASWVGFLSFLLDQLSRTVALDVKRSMAVDVQIFLCGFHFILEPTADELIILDGRRTGRTPHAYAYAYLGTPHLSRRRSSAKRLMLHGEHAHDEMMRPPAAATS